MKYDMTATKKPTPAPIIAPESMSSNMPPLYHKLSKKAIWQTKI